MWKFQGEVACGAEEEREEVAQPARSHWQGAGFTSQGQTSPPVRLRGHPADTASWGPGPPLLEPCQPQHLSAWAQHGGGFWCQLERVPAQLSGGERKNGQAARNLFGIQPQHLRPLASAFLHRAVPLCMIGELALPVREAQVE